MSTVVETGFNAMGHAVPGTRLQAAYTLVKQMVPGITTEEAMSVVGRAAQAVEEDRPYDVIHDDTLDLTGNYRLLAVLCSGPVDA